MLLFVSVCTIVTIRRITSIQFCSKQSRLYKQLQCTVGGVAQWLGCRSVAGGLSLICA